MAGLRVVRDYGVGGFDIISRVGTLVFSPSGPDASFVIDGKDIEGGGTLQFNGGGAASAVNFSGSADFTVDPGLRVLGPIGFEIVDDAAGLPDRGRITVNSAGLALQQGDSVTAALAGVRFNPLVDGSFVPTAGTATLIVAGQPVTIAFSSASRISGTVQVSVAGAAPVAHVVPGLAD
jgi:hypothetical protein